MRNADKVSCPSGHPYDEENTSRSPDNRRHCLQCQRLRDSKGRPEKETEELDAVEAEVLAAIEAWQAESDTPAPSTYIRKRLGLGAVAVIKVLAVLVERGLVFPCEISGEIPLRGYYTTDKKSPKLQHKTAVEETAKGQDKAVVSKQKEREGVPYTQTVTSKGGRLSLAIRS